MKSEYIHLHLHTKFSLLDGMCKFDEIIESARKYNMPAVAITDHGNMYGVIEFYSALNRAGIKPIIGFEAYVVDDITKKSRDNYHLVLLAKDETGYKNLIRISSYAFTDGFYYKPRVSRQFLAGNSQGLIALTSCVHGEVPSKIINNDITGAKEAAENYLAMFGEGDFYLEMQNHGLEEELIMNRGIKEISKDLSVPVVTTNDVHYMRKDDAKAHDVLLCIQTGKTLKDENRMQFRTKELYFKNFSEMQEMFPEDTDAIERTVEVANKCNFTMELNSKYFMPSYHVEGEEKTDKETYDRNLEKLAREALKNKYPKTTREIKERFEIAYKEHGLPNRIRSDNGVP